MSELKPCPFCGGDALLSVDQDSVTDTAGRKWAYVIVCSKCCATTGLTFSSRMAAGSWNRRVEDVPTL